ncbi:MAG: prolyl oligopeptidase family serine peptidase [Candidatus Eisenbacteria bacterium]|nr:prolyl oligopeptidase family serine peptidase [Candidatus Eisenbacteria bacterium]
MPSRSWTWAAVVLGMLAAGHVGAAETPARPVSIHDIVLMKDPGDACFSPDGEWIAYVLRSADLETNRRARQIYLISRRGGKPRMVTARDSAAHSPAWSPRGDHLAFLRRSAGAGPERETTEQVWLLPLDGGEAFPLTDQEHGVARFVWEPDGRSILALCPRSSGPGMQGYLERRREQGFDAEPKDKDIPEKYLWRYPVPAGDPELVFRGDRGMEEIAVHPEGEWVAYTSNQTGVTADEQQFEIYLLRLADGKTRRLTQRTGAETRVNWTHDGRGLIFTAVQIDTLSFSQLEVFVLPLEDRPLDMRDPVSAARWIPWTHKHDREVEELLWPRAAGRPFVVSHDRFSARLARLDGEGAAQWLTDPEQVIQDGAVSWDGQWLALTVESTSAPARLLLFDRDGRLIRTLADPNREAFADVRPANQRVMTWDGPGGTPIEGLVIDPWAGAEQEPPPLLVYVHGGPSWHITHEMTSSLQTWAAEGYRVLAPNYRGSTGYGNLFSISNLQDLGGGDYRDIMAGVDLMIADGLADAGRLAIMGASYGGYMTNWTITQTDRFAAAVSEYGIFSLITDFSMSDYPMWEASYLRRFYWEDLDPYLEMSPAFHAQRIETPVLILHGQEDNNTFIANSIEMYRALRTMGKTVEFHTFPREGHGFSEPAHEIEEMRLARSWFDRHVTGGAVWPPAYRDLHTLPREHLPPYMADQVRSAEGLPRLYRPGDTLRVKHGVSLEGLVGAVRTPEGYGADKPAGRFVEVEMLLAHLGEGGGYQLHLDDVVLLGPGGRGHAPVGVPYRAHGQTTLIRGENMAIRLRPESEGLPHWQTLRITFDLPRSLHRVPLVIGPFPPALINVGEAVNDR